MTDYVMVKVCSACKQELPIELFGTFKAKGQPKYLAKCKPCLKAYRKAYHETNKERIDTQRIEWGKKNPDYYANWRKKNPDKLKKRTETSREYKREYNQKRYWKDPETFRLRSRQFKAANLELIKVKKREWNSGNKEHLRKYFNGRTAALSDSYIRNKLAVKRKLERTLTSKNIPKELVELKRLQILIQRELKK